jgi:trk system potassium uptake protein TrkA
MDIIVVGCGRVGSKFAKEASKEGHNIVVVDEDKRKFINLGDDFEGILVKGNPIDEEVLKNAGIESTDAMLALTEDDNTNIMISQIAKEKFGVKKVIARIFDAEKEKVFNAFGMKSICPTNITIDVLKTKVFEGEIITNHTIGKNKIEFIFKDIPAKHGGKGILEIKNDEKQFLFGLLRENKMIFAKNSLKLKKNDKLVYARIK